MAEPRSDAAISQWDRYWDFGSLHSFSQVSGGNYEGVIADFWRQCFRTLESGARVVDIATGNGAVPLLALETADQLGITIRVDGVDLASIDPAARVTDPALREALGRVRFHSRTPAESLPFADSSVSFVSSQYGLEYSDLAAAIREIGRVSAPHARVALILHHRDSVLLQATAMELSQLDFVLDEARAWLHARNLLRAMSEQGGTGSAKVRKKRQALHDALQSVQQKAQTAPNARMLLGPINYIHEILAMVGRTPFAKLLDLLEESRQRVQANRQRLRDMVQAALGEQDMDDLANSFVEQGFVLDTREPMTETDGRLLGWEFRARRT